jgi:hypothetical protein
MLIAREDDGLLAFSQLAQAGVEAGLFALRRADFDLALVK